LAKKPGLLFLGKIIGPWGLKGEVKCFPYADLRHVLPGRDGLFLEKGEEIRFRALAGFRFHKSLVLLKFQGCEDYQGTEDLVGWEVGIPRASAPSLPADTYFHYDLIGLKVMEGQLCRGEVIQVWTSPGNDILLVEEEGRRWMLPATKEVIREVDLEKGELHVDLPMGLRDLEEV
jgi:16S rRNA processing protein RimM